MSPAVRQLAVIYRTRRIGRHAGAVRDLVVPYIELLKRAGCSRGPTRSEAEAEFRAMERRGLVKLECASRDASVILRVRLPSASESAFFEHVGEAGPMTERGQLAALFEAAAVAVTPPPFVEDWQTFCRELAREANSGVSLLPCFDRANAAQVAQILGALPRLLSWRGESLRRFASAVTFGDSKTLEALQPRIEACLGRLTAGRFETLNQLGIRENPRSVILHGPLTLKMPGGALDLGHLGAPFRIGAADLETASITTAATRCVTVENAAMLHELAKNQSGAILASSGSEGGFAHTAIVNFLCALPATMELYHFGDSDPSGFDILRHLRERTALSITSLHMSYRPMSLPVPLSPEDLRTIRRLLETPHLTADERFEIGRMLAAEDKGAFEQESLGVPCAEWPFYRARF